ncbi:MAG: threonylcarbamoyl-AMP synthase [Prevotellaceae bacterium]|jgi:tRNA threonylcarbamoyl adenosine modification protein (Sua5/YciO/YrdC/YwlC family)|nr:threonylcarbamoyl-AMP synthase [Prevotellaceae bacterium]
MLIRIHPDSPEERAIERVAEILRNDGVVIYPTDSVYSIGCWLRGKKALDRIRQIRGMKQKHNTFSLICDSLSNLSDYAKVDNPVFKILKKNLPGAFTFILPASGRVPDKLLGKRKQIGLRIPDNRIATAIVAQLECPLLGVSLKGNDEFSEYFTDPELIEERFGRMVDACIDGGTGGIVPSTVVDCTNREFEILRQGRGELIV